MLVQCSPTPPLSGEGPLEHYISHKKAQPLLSHDCTSCTFEHCRKTFASLLPQSTTNTQTLRPLPQWLHQVEVVEQLLSLGANACIKEPKNEW